jgi:hypothetical protein
MAKFQSPESVSRRSFQRLYRLLLILPQPIWLAEAAELAIAHPPTTQRIAGSRHSLSASFTSS